MHASNAAALPSLRMNVVLVFAVALLAATLVSELASRSVLSTAVLFLCAGAITGPLGFDWVRLQPEDRAVETLVDVALFSVLFTDGMQLGVRKLAEAWRLPGRALLLGMPLSFVATAVLAHWLTGLHWPESFLLGAVLAPTDPVFAGAIVGREEVPERLRHLLNVESGLNDGLALPVVLGLLAFAGGGEVQAPALLIEVLIGLGIGIAVPWLVLKLAASRPFNVHEIYEPLLAFAIALLVFALTSLAGGNAFLAAFSAGVTVATVSDKASSDFKRFGAVVAELTKLAALLVFGAMLTPSTFADFDTGAWLFVPLALLLPRPAGVLPALIGSPLDRRETLAAAWFGPKGFASVAYALLLRKSGLEQRDYLFHLIAAVITLSIVAHASTDVVIARWFGRRQARRERTDSEEPQEPQRGRGPPA